MSQATVRVEGEVTGTIDAGLLVFLGVDRDDDDKDLEWMVGKVTGLRVFEDQDGRMNLSVREIEAGILVISQFTLFGNLRKGTRPSFNQAADPTVAETTYELFLDKLGGELGRQPQAGRFGADMKIEALNDGPVTIVIDSKDKRF